MHIASLKIKNYHIFIISKKENVRFFFVALKLNSWRVMGIIA